MVGVQLVNLSRHQTRHLIVQAGAFGQHQLTEIRYDDGSGERRGAARPGNAVETPAVTVHV